MPPALRIPPSGTLRFKLLVGTGGLLVAWTILLVTIWAIDRRSNYTEAEAFALSDAEAAFQKDALYRLWVSQQGGVYVRPTAATPPNPFLADLPERDITTTSGQQLTLVNPAYMTRMVHTLGDTLYGVRGHITSLNPLNPGNTPDDWERKGLEAFENGKREVTEITQYRGEPVLRLIRPFVTDQSCLKCHAHQGYKVGSIRGGISTTVPLKKYYAAAESHNRTDGFVLLGFYLLGLATITIGGNKLYRTVGERERAHAALVESERRAKQTIERIPLAAVTCTVDGCMTYGNPAFLATTGRQLTDIVGRNFFELFVPRAHRAEAEESIREIVARRTPQANSIGYLTAAGEKERTIDWLHTLITEADGTVVGWSSIGHDVTEKNAEDLRMRLLSLAVAQSPVSVVITDRNGKIEYVNRRFAEVTGFSEKEALEQNPRVLSSGQMPREFFAEMWSTILAGHEWHGVFHNRRRNGEHFWENARISPVRDATGEIVRFIAMKEDITEQRRTEQALAESERRFRTLVENAPVAVVVHNESRCIYANSAALRMFGYSETTNPAGIDIRAHIRASSSAAVKEREARTRAGKPNPSIELDLMRCDGSHLACESIATEITFNDKPAILAMLVDISERRQMLVALEESEARYRALVEIAPVAIFAITNGRFTFANPATARLLGFAEPTELLGQNLWQHIHPDSLGLATAMIADADEGGEPRRTDLTLLRKDRAPLNCASIAVRVPIGQQASVLVLGTDITAQRKLLDALRENEARMRETLESTNAGYFLLDEHHQLLHANSAFLEYFSIPSAAIEQQRSLPELLPASCRATIEDSLHRLTCGEEFVGGQLVVRAGSAEASYFSYTAHIVREGERITGCEGFVLDTTEAQMSEQRYQMLFERMLDGFALHEFVYDRDGQPSDYRFLAINPAFEKIIGKPAADVVGRTVRQVLPGIEEKWILRYAKVALEGEPIRTEDFSSDLGRYFDVSAFQTGEGKFAVLTRDVTEQHRLEEQLRQAQKMEAVGQLAGGVAHDYNNILVAILMNLSILRSEAALSPETVESLSELEREAKRAATLTRQLLVFSRRQAVQADTVDFNDQLANTLSMLRRLLGENIAIETELAPDLQPIIADPGMLDQVVMNLCVNARDAMPGGGRLLLSTTAIHLAAGPTSQHPESRPGDFLLFTVRDSGTGISPEVCRHIFEPFFTTKEVGKGTGLGLATVLSIVKQHDGWIEVDSRLGSGTTFRIYLPFSPRNLAPPVPPHAAAPANHGESPSHTILLVEDDTVSRQTISLSLRRDHHDVIEAGTVEEALALWKKHRDKIAALITDVVMPGASSGLDLAQTLHAEDPELSIIIISGYSNRAEEKTPMVEDAVYLPKPFDYTTLIQSLRASLARRGGH